MKDFSQKLCWGEQDEWRVYCKKEKAIEVKYVFDSTRYMMQRTDAIIIVVFDRQKSGTSMTVEMARRMFAPVVITDLIK